MNTLSLRRTVVVITLLLGTSPFFALALHAAESGRRYGDDNSFQGTYRKGRSGIIRLYDENGTFEGTVVPDKDGDGYRRYDWNNTFLGSIDEDDQGD